MSLGGGHEDVITVLLMASVEVFFLLNGKNIAPSKIFKIFI